MFSIAGKVIKGDGYGKKIGFPTVNLDRRGNARLINKSVFGVYKGEAMMGGKKYKAGIVLGPFDKKGLPKIEAHIIGLNKNLYVKEVELRVGSFLRAYKKFKNEKDLIRQVSKDIDIIKKYE